MKSLTGKFSSARGWAVTLILLFGAGLFVAACGDEEVPSPTTPAPPPPAPPPAPAPEPEPEPAPEPPAVPVGLRISASGMDFIEWSWNAVEGVSGYDVQYSANEAFTVEDETIARTAEEISYRREGLEAGASAFLRVRAAAGTGEERVTSDWSTHVTGMTAEPEPEVPAAPAAPANVRLKDRGSDFIEWEWDEVSGADGYESQFSTDGTSFGGQEAHAGASQTSRKVSNLAAETAGHLRVRSYTGSGTGADTVRGDWSASDRQTTDEPPPAVALDAPDDFESSDPDENSILLEWDEVDNADHYEVEQREEGDSSWDDASCGSADGDNETDDAECIASGLDEGTDYEFRVRAIPADDDTAYTTGAWAEADGSTEGTAPTEPTTPITGGTGDLNVEWTSDATGITWIWERMPGATYDYLILSGQDLPRETSTSPCANQDYVDSNSGSVATSAKHDSTDGGEVALLCVRTTNPGNLSENLSFARAVTPPSAPAAPVAAGVSPGGDSGKKTKSLTWTGITVQGGFVYEMNTVEDPERDNSVTPTRPAEGRALQSACNGGRLHESDETDVELTGLETTFTSVNPYAGYLLCLRMRNSSGVTDWAVPAQNAEHQTAPGQAPRPSKNGTRSEDDRDAENEKIVWNILTRRDTKVPRNIDGYTLKVIQHPDKVDTDDEDNFHDDGVTRPKVATCGDDDFDASPYDLTVPNTTGLTSEGFTVTVSIARPDEEVKVGEDSQGTARNAIISEIVSLCIQAKYGDGADERLGPWNISSAEVIEKQKE